MLVTVVCVTHRLNNYSMEYIYTPDSNHVALARELTVHVCSSEPHLNSKHRLQLVRPVNGGFSIFHT